MKKIFSYFIVISLSISVVSCASSVKVDYHFNTEEDFEQFKTYDYLTFPENSQMNEYVLKRTKVYLNQHLENKGMRQTSENPDLLIAIHTQVRSKIQISHMGYSYAPQVIYWSSYGYYGSYGWEAREFQKGTLVVDFVDAQDREMIWRGIADGSIPETPQSVKLDQIVEKAVDSMMKYYPPPPVDTKKD
jgi:hypothetical protein